MNLIKPKVKLYGTRPEMAIVYSVVCSVYEQMGYDCIVTSGVGMKHGPRSLHPVGFAEDYRTKHLNSTDIKRKLVEKLKDALPCCDIVLEHLDQPQEHVHVEFDDHFDEQFQEDKLWYRKHGKWPT